MRHDSMNRLLRAGALAVLAFSGAAAQAAGPYTGLVVFGDSLSDNGNNYAAGLYAPAQVITGNSYVPSFTYASKTYSDGPVWANYFASMLGLSLTPSLAGGTDYAFGGAVTGSSGSFPYSLREQAGMYLGATGGTASADALYVIAGGGNNARAGLTAIGGGGDPATVIGSVSAAFASDIGFMVDQLQAAGAQHIMVWNVPNLGGAPAVAGLGPTVAGLGSFLAASMNSALSARLAGEAGVEIFDLFSFGTAVAANPGAAGFTDASNACGAISGADCSKYLYWDGIHPTTAAHQAIAGAMFAAAVPEPQTYGLMALGLVVLAWRRRVAA